MIKDESKGKMEKLLKTIACSILCLHICMAYSAHADEDFTTWKKTFYQQALTAGVKKKTLDLYVPQMDLLPKIIEQDVKLPEYIPTFQSYIQTRLTPTKIEGGQFMQKRYPSYLDKIEQKYFVPSEYLIALWGMETNYGKFMGNVDMLDSLASLAYHPRRRKFFTNQLISYLKILETEPVPPKIGSWDAGFGHFQFMPGTFEAYAVDGDEDSARDLIGSVPDAVASAANYLHKLGWNPNELWGREVLLPKNINWDIVLDGKRRSVSEWQKIGIHPAGLSEFPKTELDIEAGLTAPMGSKGPVFLTYPNFRRIMNWNKYELYALSVGLLSDALAGRSHAFYTTPQEIKIKSTDIQELQTKLSELGYDVGPVDGKLGKKSRHALQQFQTKVGLIPDGYPNQQILDILTTYRKEN